MHLSEIDLNLLGVLHAVIETRSVKLAARRLALSPSATSHALARLRDQLGDPIVVRAGRGLVLTPRAERLRPDVARLLEDIERVLSDDAEVDPAGLRRAFTISTDDYGEQVVIVPLSHRLAQLAPGVDLFATRRGSFVDEIRSGTHDLLLGVVSNVPPDLESEPVTSDEFVVLLRRKHPAARGRLTLKRYASLDHVLVAPRGTPRGVVDTILEANGLHRRIARTVATFAVAPHVVAGSDYVLTIAGRIARPIADQLDLVVRPAPKPLEGFRMSMVWHRRTRHDPAHAWLRDQVRAAAPTPTRA